MRVASSRCELQVPGASHKFQVRVASSRCELQVPGASFKSQESKYELWDWVWYLEMLPVAGFMCRCKYDIKTGYESWVLITISRCKLQVSDASYKCEFQVPGASFESQELWGWVSIASSGRKLQVSDASYKFQVHVSSPKIRVLSPRYECQNTSSKSIRVPKSKFGVWNMSLILIGSIVHASCKVLISGWRVSITSPKIWNPSFKY